MRMLSDVAQKAVQPNHLVNIANLITAYFSEQPDTAVPEQCVSFGSAGHCGCAFNKSFNEQHVLAIAQAISEHRKLKGIDGPLYLGMDTHALSVPAFVSALEVFAANDVIIMVDSQRGYTPTPAISLAILNYNRSNSRNLADGVMITSSHNPPEDGGIKYNPPQGGPADAETASFIEQRANEILRDRCKQVRRLVFDKAIDSPNTHKFDYMELYVNELASVIDMDKISSSRVLIGVHPMGGAGVAYWPRIAEQYNLNLEVLSTVVDPTFSFMNADLDGKIRIDCSSPQTMANVVAQKNAYAIVGATNPDDDICGIVTRTAGLMDPNHYLAVASDYLFASRHGWTDNCAIGKTVVNSSMIDRVARRLGKQLFEVPPGFKWFVNGLRGSSIGIAGGENGGASFLRRDGSVWTTDEDGIIMYLLAAEMTAVKSTNPEGCYINLMQEFGTPIAERIEVLATARQVERLRKLSTNQIDISELAGERIIEKITHAAGNGVNMQGLKVVTENAWFAALPSASRGLYEIHAESFLGKDHLRQVQFEAQELLSIALGPPNEQNWFTPF